MLDDDNSDIERVLTKDIFVYDSDRFIAGRLHVFPEKWSEIATNNEVLDWINNKVDITKFFSHFKGDFQGVNYDCSIPPPRVFQNSKSCRRFDSFVTREIQDRLRSGAISYVGPVETTAPPRVVSPLTVEPSKPRLCMNLMYINSFMRDTPFVLDTLTDVPLLVKKNSYLTKLDDKSGYDHVLMTESSRPFLGFQWDGHYFSCNTLPFGWKNSAYVYHTLNLTAMSFLRGKGINGLIYIDDRLIEEFKGPVRFAVDCGLIRSQIAIRFAVITLANLGYVLNMKKSLTIPTQRLTFLGLEIDTVSSSFYVPEKRKLKLACIREFILSHHKVSVQVIQKFIGLCISMVLAIPGAKLFTAEGNRALSDAALNALDNIKISPGLRTEVEYWRFLDSWEKPFPWLSERHVILKLSSDASGYKWAAVLHNGDVKTEISDFWSTQEIQSSIMVKEALALYNALKSVGDKIRNCRVCASVDNMGVIHAWKNQYVRSPEINRILKMMFTLLLQENCILTLSYVPSSTNEADAPSRSLSKLDTMLSPRTWAYIDMMFGPHTVDMFALDSNAMRDNEGNILKHFTLFPTPMSGGVDAFAQSYSRDENYYAFPPFCLVQAVVKFVIDEGIRCSIVFPLARPYPSWFPLIAEHFYMVPVGLHSDKGVLLYPSKSGFLSDKKGLPWDLMCARYKGTFGMAIRNVSTHTMWEDTFSPVVVVGDSMVRFLQLKHRECKEVSVYSVGGATLLDSLQTVREAVNFHSTHLVIFHSGTNNINKYHKQLSDAVYCMEYVFSQLKCLQDQKCFAVLVSACVRVRDHSLNDKIDIFNKRAKELCMRYRFRFVWHDNILSDDLRDAVHLNSRGELKFTQNLWGYL